ncbi:MAG: hypothetical protein P1U34_10260 [Coxiellaceae bacterium]|nr:hypothetical protein [Coxiellaceae bacterium]
MSRHPLVTDSAFDIPPPRRNKAFEQKKLDYMRTLYGISGPEMPCYVFHENSVCKYKKQMAKLYDACESMAIELGLSGEGFKESKRYFCAHGNYLVKGQEFHRNLKHLYELIYFRLENMKKGGLAKQTMLRNSVRFLEQQIRMCPTGLFTSLNKLAQELDQVGTEVESLEEMRQNTIDSLYDYHNAFYRISLNLESHTLLQLKKTAARIDFKLRDSAEADEFIDETAHLIPYSDADAAFYAAKMNSSYTPELIAQNLVAFYTERLLEFRKTAADDAVGEQKQAPGEVAPAPARHRKNIINPDHRSEMQHRLKPLFETGVITTIHSVIEWNDELTDGWVSSDFLDKLQLLMPEHIIRQGYVLSPELVQMNILVEKIRQIMTHPDIDISDGNKIILNECCAELEALNYLPYLIPDGDLMAGGVVRPCLSHRQRGEAALYIMQRMLQAYVPVERLQMNEDLTGFTAVDDPIKQHFQAWVGLFCAEASVSIDPEICAQSYQQVQQQKLRVDKFEVHQTKLRQQAKLDDAKNLVARNMQAKLKSFKIKRQFQQENNSATKVQAVMRGYLTRKQLHQDKAAKKLQLATRNYVARLHQGDWQVARVRRVIDAIVKPFKTTDDKAKSLAYQLAFNNDEAARGEVKPPLLAVRDMPQGTPLSRSFFYHYIEDIVEHKYCVAEDNTLHLLTNATWGLTPTTGYVVVGAEQGAAMSKIVRRVAQGEISRKYHYPLIHLRLMRDEYAEEIAKNWRPEWLTATNFKLLSQSNFSNMEPKKFAQVLRLTAEILPKLSSPQLSTEIIGHLNWWLGESYDAETYSRPLFLYDLEKETLEDKTYLSRLRKIDRLFTCNASMKKLGGIAAFHSQSMELFAKIKRGAFETETVNYDIQLTDRAATIVKILLGLSGEGREYYIAKMNRYVDAGYSADLIAHALFPHIKPSLARARVGGAPAGAPVRAPAPARAAAGIGVFAPPPGIRKIKPREQGMFDRTMDRYIAEVHKEIAVFKADGIRAIELGYYDDKITKWTKPYRSEHLLRLYELAGYMQYLARSRQSGYRLDSQQKACNCEVLFNKVDKACDNFRLMTRALATDDFTEMRDAARKAHFSLDDLVADGDIPTYEVRL